MNMLRIKKMVPNPQYDPAVPHPQPFIWEYKDADRDLQIGDVVHFLCNGRGRGGHYRVTARVTKVNKKTFKALELPRSYSPGTRWTVHIDTEDCIEIDLSWKD